jgi:hypothetical protein
MDVTLVIYDVLVPCRGTPGGSARGYVQSGENIFSDCKRIVLSGERFSGKPIKRDRQIMSGIRPGTNGWSPVGGHVYHCVEIVFSE